MIIIRENPQPVRCSTLTLSVKLGNNDFKRIEDMKIREFDKICQKMNRSENQRNERKAKR
jgi:hypothetical protein